MRGFVLSVVATLAFASTGFAQTEVLRGTSTDTRKVTTSAAKPASAQAQKPATTPQNLRGSRYGGFAPSTPTPVNPPALDTASPRTLTLLNVNTKETLSVTYWSNGTYHRDALDKLNGFLRDSQNNQQTEMDPLLFDVLWHTMNLCDYHGEVEVLSAFRSPTTNAWLASVSRGVARDSQHMNGNAMDIRFPKVPVFKIRQAARSLQMGGVGFYPRSGFVHLDTGPVRYW
jgi:uncharacterized protein YcbK (DUF882 family)